MNVSTGSRVRGRNWGVAAVVAGLALACSPEQTPAKSAQVDQKFVFAPHVGLVFHHEMKHIDALTVTGSPFRDAQEWRILWEVRIDQEGDKYLYHRRLLELAFKLNDQVLFAGSEVAARKAEIVQVMSHDGHALDVTGTEQLTQALTSLVPEAARSAVAEAFSPAAMRELLLARAVDAFDEVVGKPAKVGDSWTVSESDGPLRAKTVRVDSALACGAAECRKLVRTYDVDREKVGDLVRARVASFVRDQHWDATSVAVVDANVKVEDTFVVEPATCLFHDALLTEQGHMLLQGPAGAHAEVVLTATDASHADYPPPS